MIRWRVVCGLWVIILIRSPTNVFIRVDFPAFGRPIILTKPDLNDMVNLFAALAGKTVQTPGYHGINDLEHHQGVFGSAS
jgi:hypothetical protein